MRKLIYGMNLSLDGYIAAPGDDIGWGGPSDGRPAALGRIRVVKIFGAVVTHEPNLEINERQTKRFLRAATKPAPMGIPDS
jgi:hypothetical protein